MKKDDKEQLNIMRHSAAHLLAAAVNKLYPGTKFGIGPVIENGFYYDFDLPRPISEEDLPKIEAKMEEIKKKNLPLEKLEVPIDQALSEMKEGQQSYKVELIEQIKKTGNTEVEETLEGKGQPSKGKEKISSVCLYKLGDFTDLCRGPHVETTSQIGAFKLLSLAGAYWRGSEKNKMLTRIYGTSFLTQKELDEYQKQIEEAKKRDHKKLGPQLGLFLFHETAPGMPYWLPKGVIIVNELINFWREEHTQRGYQEIISPLINKKELYLTSGHWEHYKENMFICNTEEGEVYCAKPMNCPNAMVVYGSKPRSYKELPLRLGDTDTLHRYERSGTLNGLLRVREFRQDDAHIFVSEDQIKDEYKRIFEIVERFYSIFGMEYSFRMGTRPEKFMGDIASWDKAEATLKTILEESGREYLILEGDGAFYGPKIDILMKDVLGRDWQMGTIQLDFQIPKNFHLTYTDANGQEKVPAVIHRVIYGSLERFIGILIEHYAGAFPVWLSPVQVQIIPITTQNVKYAQKVAQHLKDQDIRVEVDDRPETMQAKIRDAQLNKIPFMLIVGNREEKENKVSIRLRSGKDQGAKNLEEAFSEIKDIIDRKASL